MRTGHPWYDFHGMRKITGFLAAVFFSGLNSCRDIDKCLALSEKISAELRNGNLHLVKTLSDSLFNMCPEETSLISVADSFCQIADRIALEFPVDEDLIASQLGEKSGDYSEEEKAEWERLGWLEFRMLDGKKKYFDRAASNLYLIRMFHLHTAQRDSLRGRRTRNHFQEETYTGSYQ